MSIVSQYEVSATFPSIVGGTGVAAKYFFSNPPQSLWNAGQPGVNTPQQSSQLGQVPTATTAFGQLPFPLGLGSQAGSGKVVGTRFRIYMSGSASSAIGPTLQPQIQLNKGTAAVASYVSLAQPTAATIVAGNAVAFSIALDMMFDYASGTLSGFAKNSYETTAGVTTNSAAETVLPAVTGLTLGQASAPPTGVGVGAGFPGMGFVCNVIFGTSDASNSASLYEFKIVQD
jgi:hypothetical protein